MLLPALSTCIKRQVQYVYGAQIVWYAPNHANSSHNGILRLASFLDHQIGYFMHYLLGTPGLLSSFSARAAYESVISTPG